MNATRNYVRNTYSTAGNYLETMSSTRKILLVVVTAFLLFAVFYWAFHANKNHLANMKYQRLITPYTVVEQIGESISENVYGSPNGAEITFSFWLKVKNFTPEPEVNSPQMMNQLFTLNNVISVGIDRNTNNLQVNLLEASGGGGDGSSGSNPVVEFENIPFYTWTHYIVAISGRYITFYQNGQLVKTTLLTSIPVTMHNYTITTGSSQNNSAFVAELGNFYYFAKAITKNDIAILVNQMPKIPKNQK